MIASHALKPGTSAPDRETALTVGSAHDPAERDAERSATTVVQALAGLSRPSANPADLERPSAGAERSGGVIRRMKSVRGAEDGGSLAPGTSETLRRLRAGGASIEPVLRRELEGTMDADLSGVRLHSGPESQGLNESMSAKAFTHGRDIYFRDGMPDVSTKSGMHLLAHEVAHAVQGDGASNLPIRRMTARSSEGEGEKDTSVSTLQEVNEALTKYQSLGPKSGRLFGWIRPEEVIPNERPVPVASQAPAKSESKQKREEKQSQKAEAKLKRSEQAKKPNSVTEVKEDEPNAREVARVDKVAMINRAIVSSELLLYAGIERAEVIEVIRDEVQYLRDLGEATKYPVVGDAEREHRTAAANAPRDGVKDGGKGIYYCGSANQPHVHFYPNGFHLKKIGGENRINVVQDGKLYLSNLSRARMAAENSTLAKPGDVHAVIDKGLLAAGYDLDVY